MTLARRSLGLGAWTAAAAFWACASPPLARPPAELSAELAAFLPDPGPLAGGAEGAELSRLHDRLLGEGASSSARRSLEEALSGSSVPAARLLSAEIALAGGEAERALALLAALPPALATQPECRLTGARAAEDLARWSDAVEGYRAAAGRYPVAAERARALEPRAVSEADAAVVSALARGHWEEADRQLERLTALRPEDERTLERRLSVATAIGDRKRELDALRSLARMSANRPDLDLRRGVLEAELGDATAGLALLQALVAKHPDDAEPRAALERAKFLFRLANAPDELRALAAQPELRRADYARLLYWLVPGVRSARGGASPIATDIFDHPAREEIVRIAGLGLMRVDEELHRFDPERPVRRLEVFDSLAALARQGGGSSAAEGGCRYAAASGWIASLAECLPGGAVSGPEASEWIRAATSAPAAGGVEP